MNKEDLTVHCVVKNEPFIYYAVKSIYDYCNTILLYDTGSDDKFTLEDIKQLLKEDIGSKRIFKQHLIEFDEHNWTDGNYNKWVNRNRGKRGVAQVRQRQIEETKTPFHMVVDGDEVHYKETMENILKYNMPEHILMTQLPLIWFYDLEHTFSCYSPTGRIMRTNEVQIRKNPPGDILVVKRTQAPMHANSPTVNQLNHLKPFAHFETYLKPFRRKHKIKPQQIKKFTGLLPEVMLENTYYMERFENVK